MIKGSLWQQTACRSEKGDEVYGDFAVHYQAFSLISDWVGLTICAFSFCFCCQGSSVLALEL